MIHKDIPISEIFYSIQGEGKNLGMPFIFVRFAGCNMQCQWCDSKYASFKNQLEFTLFEKEELLDEIKNLSNKYQCSNILFTGGEPLLQQKTIEKIIKNFDSFYFEVETNGSIPIETEFNQVNVSYKLSNSGIDLYPLRISPAPNVSYKFVIQSENDIHEAMKICSNENIPKESIYFMPEGIDKNTLEKRSKWLVEKCKKVGVKFTPRLHIMIWENSRGK